MQRLCHDDTTTNIIFIIIVVTGPTRIKPVGARRKLKKDDCSGCPFGASQRAEEGDRISPSKSNGQETGMLSSIILVVHVAVVVVI